MNPTSSGIRAGAAPSGAAPCGVVARADAPPLDLGDASVRRRLRAALERELAVAIAAGDQAARERLLASVQSAITT